MNNYDITKNIRIFFFDIDSTTLDHSISKVRDLTMYALKQLKERGYKICICTSRTIAEMAHLPKDYVSLFDGIACEAGAILLKDGQKYCRYLEQYEVEKAMKYFASEGITYRYADDNGVGYLNQKDKDKEALFYRLYQMIPEIKDYDNERLTHILYYRNSDEDFENLKKLLSESQHVKMTFACEITPLNTNKGTAIIEMAKLFGFGEENTCAFGDGGNDVEMIKSASLGIAMGNGCKEIKEVADIVADDISNDGLYKVLVEYGFIDRKKGNC